MSVYWPGQERGVPEPRPPLDPNDPRVQRPGESDQEYVLRRAQENPVTQATSRIPTAANPVQDPRYPGVQYTGDWGETHPWHPVDMSAVRSPMDYVAQVDQMGEWAGAQDKARAAEIRKDPNSFIVQSGTILPKPSWLARNGPKLALFAVGAIATAGIANAAMAGGAAASAGGGTAASAAPGLAATGPGIVNGAGIGTLLTGGADVATKAGSILNWAQILGPLAGNLVGAKVGANANDRAAEIQAKTFADALAEQRRQYEQDRQDEQTALALEAQRHAEARNDFAPYLGAGQGAVTRMSDLMAHTAVPQLPGNVAAVMGAPAHQVAPYGGGNVWAPQPSATPQVPTLGQPQAGVSTAMPVSTPAQVHVQFPDGTSQAVPVTQLSASLSKGAKVVAVA